jgi:hypothetical protein
VRVQDSLTLPQLSLSDIAASRPGVPISSVSTLSDWRVTGPRVGLAPRIKGHWIEPGTGELNDASKSCVGRSMILLAVVARVVIGGLLVFGGAAKLAAGDAYRRNWLSAFVKLPPRLEGPMATAFSLLEIGVGSAFMLGLGKGLSAWAASLLIGLVTLTTTATLVTGRRPACGCAGGFSESRISWRLVVRNCLFVVVAGVLGGSGSLGPGFGTAAVPIGVLAWAATATTGYLAVDWLATRRSKAEVSAKGHTDHGWRSQNSEVAEG